MSDRLKRLLPRSKRARADRRRRVVVLVGGLAVAGYLYERDRTGSIYHPHARFVAAADADAAAAGSRNVRWPLYGYTKDHTRFFPAPASAAPAVQAPVGATTRTRCSSSRR